MREHTGYRFDEIQEMDYELYLFFLRDAFIYRMSQSEQGIEYLKKCWILQQTKPDRETLRDRYGKGENIDE